MPHSPTADPLALLERAVQGFAAHLQPSGELHDPVHGVPTQYGTPYYAFANAALARLGSPATREEHLDRAVRGANAALDHITDPSRPAPAAGFDRGTGSVTRNDHRDFGWPPVLKTYRVLRDLGSPQAAGLAERIRAVDVERSFRMRPPHNWSAVWLSGEWLRHREGLSPHPVERIDTWLGAFFQARVLTDLGLYLEPGLPNSYDLFTRLQLADMMAHGYDGVLAYQMRRLLTAGLSRSLDVQLSDGSLASAGRSTGHSWTVAAQIAFFTKAARVLGHDSPDLARRARAGATRAFASLVRWSRSNGALSPVENLLPATYRVGYEHYTADAHYSSLAAAYLADALLHGFVPADDSGGRTPTARIEHSPTYRATAHNGAVSVHVNTHPAEGYDAYGIADLTFGPGRFLHFVSSVRHVATGELFNPGLACRDEPGRAPLRIPGRRPFVRMQQIVRSPHGLTVDADGHSIDIRLRPDGVTIHESTPGDPGHKTLLLPYPVDPGIGVRTRLDVDGDTLRLVLGDEVLEITLDQPIGGVLDLPYGYESRRGLCGLLRIDVAAPCLGLTYAIRIVR